MKRIILNIIFLFPILSIAQFSSIIKQTTIGCHSNDIPSDLIIDSDKSYVLAGSIGNYSSASCTTLAPSGTKGGLDGWVTILDSSFNLKWSRVYGGSNEDRLLKIRKCSEGGYIAIGYTTSSNGDILSPNKGMHDYWILRIAVDGNIIWSKTFGSTGYDDPYDIIETNDQGFIIVGSLGMNDGDAAGLTLKGSNDAWIIKINASGNIVWQKAYGSSKSDYASTIVQVSNKSYIVCGRASAGDGDLTLNNGAADLWVFKITDVGILLWSKNFGGSNTEMANCVFKNSDGDVLIGASSNSSDKDVKNHYGDNDYWLVKIDTNGNLYWQKNYGGTKDDQIKSIVESSEGGYLLVGNSNSSDHDAIGLHGTLYNDILAIKINDTGKVDWSKMYGGTSSESGGICYQLGDSSYVLSAITNSNNGDIAKAYGWSDAWVIKLNKWFPANVNEHQFSKVKVYPTLTSGIVNIANDKLIDTKITITNTMGEGLNIPYQNKIGERMYDFSSFPKGIYIITIFMNDQKYNYKIVLK